MEVIILGAGGGPMEDNTTALLIRSTSTSWGPNSVLAVDAGVHLAAISRILEQHSPVSSTDPLPTTISSGPFKDLKIKNRNPNANAIDLVKDVIGTHLITHPHLDHISAFVINTAGFNSAERKTLAGMPTTIEAFKTHIFNGIIWPNLSDENGGFSLVTYLRMIPGGSPLVPDGGYVKLCEGLHAKGVYIAHGHCRERHFREPDLSLAGLPHTPRSPASPQQPVPTRHVHGHTAQALAQDGPASEFHHSVPESDTINTHLGARCVTDSTAFFIRDVASEQEIIVFGDLESDSTSGKDLNRKLWIEAAPKMAAGLLKGLVIECSYSNSRPDALLFGHLTPFYLFEELQVLAGFVEDNNINSLRNLQIGLRSTSVTAREGPRPASLTLRPNANASSSTSGRWNRPLDGLKIVIIHVKETLDDGPSVNDTILSECVELETCYKCKFHCLKNQPKLVIPDKSNFWFETYREYLCPISVLRVPDPVKKYQPINANLSYHQYPDMDAGKGPGIGSNAGQGSLDYLDSTMADEEQQMNFENLEDEDLFDDEEESWEDAEEYPDIERVEDEALFDDGEQSSDVVEYEDLFESAEGEYSGETDEDGVGVWTGSRPTTRSNSIDYPKAQMAAGREETKDKVDDSYSTYNHQNSVVSNDDMDMDLQVPPPVARRRNSGLRSLGTPISPLGSLPNDRPTISEEALQLREFLNRGTKILPSRSEAQPKDFSLCPPEFSNFLRSSSPITHPKLAADKAHQKSKSHPPKSAIRHPFRTRHRPNTPKKRTSHRLNTAPSSDEVSTKANSLPIRKWSSPSISPVPRPRVSASRCPGTLTRTSPPSSEASNDPDDALMQLRTFLARMSNSASPPSSPRPSDAKLPSSGGVAMQRENSPPPEQRYRDQDEGFFEEDEEPSNYSCLHKILFPPPLPKIRLRPSLRQIEQENEFETRPAPVSFDMPYLRIAVTCHSNPDLYLKYSARQARRRTPRAASKFLIDKWDRIMERSTGGRRWRVYKRSPLCIEFNRFTCVSIFGRVKQEWGRRLWPSRGYAADDEDSRLDEWGLR
ncbi:hypothetical protein GLAREA_05507 [Glarea lozoyensis ATCC 20868]|uniref:3',5'-cyclic-nucleotide phosphodiesterase n=1 Tax=Glarea lozoyensis (strain ATCC 20868 / MF5171) TaxID=1116229 RepID=S3DGB1_GLAL2|nr:uncharacterized protein GLAREA_05507 [Glarea lozoyensis ATCC 20868]EPE36169.1 hypothetical protein GLAREA_05507 [Glarea lozoyensis ATCC 20868]